MKNNRRMHRVWSMILCCVLLLGLLPTAALAVNIDSFNVWIDEPKAGEKFDFAAETNINECDVVNVRWFDVYTTTEMGADSVAQAGGRYEVRIQVRTASGYSISQNTYAGINGYRAVIEGSSLRMTFDIAAAPEPLQPIESVEVTGIDVPRPGQTPDYSAAAADNTYEVCSSAAKGNFYTGVYWYDLTSSKVLKPYDTFVAGHQYRVWIDLLTTGDNIFATTANGAPSVTASVDGQRANVTKYLSEAASGEINVYCDFSCENKTIASVGITGLDAPKDGKAPDYSVELSGTEYGLKPSSSSNPFVVSGVSWYDETAGNTLTATGKFVAGHTYTATVYLVPATGYQFRMPVSGNIDRNTATITGNGSEIQVKYTFPALATNQITTVAIEGLTAPITGASPSYVAIVRGEGYSLKARNDAYYKNGICWSVMEGSDLPVSSGATFEGGQKYQVMMYLVAEEGYEFAAIAGGALQVKATLNGKPVLQEILGNQKEIVVTYYFTEATDEAVITSAAVTGIDAPVIGVAPDYTADIADTRYALEGSSGVREKNGITWINNKTGNAMVVGTDKFEAGVSYSVVVGVTAKDGYAFQTDRLGALQITGSINGELVEVSGQDEYTAYLTYTFEALAEKKTLSSIAITTVPAKTEYKTGDTFDPTGMVVTATYADKSTAAVTSYTFTPNGKLAANNSSVTISYTEGNITKTTKQAIKVTQAKTPASLAVTTAPTKTSYIAGESFNSVGMVVSVTYLDKSTAAITGYTVTPGILTADTNSVTIGYTENEKTVYATQAVTVKAAINPFSDIKESDYFHDSVLWAVSNGVTNGTSATTFSPHMTCSQAHILTFLWRAVGSPEPTIASPYSNAAVKSDQYFYKAFVWAWEQGLIGNTAHDPNAPCSRSDVVTYLWKLDGSPKTGSSNFTDVPASAPYAQAVAWAVQNGVTNGTSATTFSPDATCTRGQIVTFLWRYMSI